MYERRTAVGFTIVELLVVIGIIAVIISILLPALNRARGAAKGVACLANLRNLANSVSLYTAGNRGILSFSPAAQSSYFSLSQKTDGSQRTRLNQCPALDYIDPGQSALNASYMTYGWNSLLMRYAGTPSVVLRASRLRSVSELFLLGDHLTSDDKGLALDRGSREPGGPVVSIPNDGSVLDPFAFFSRTPRAMTLARPNFHGRHNGQAAVLWVDGHATLNTPIPIPLTTIVGPSFIDPKFPPTFYRQNRLGYFAGSPKDLGSMSALYYYVSKKSALSNNDVNVTIKDLY